MRTRHAFTLIEVLVVVAIIALLMSILLPALKAARAQAREVRCRTQLREYGKGFQYYLAEYRDIFPPHKQLNDQPPYWYHLIDRYFRSGEMVLNPAGGGKGDASLYLARCPDLNFGRRDDSGTSWEWEYTRGRIGYGYNDFWLGCYSNDWALKAYGNVRTVLWRRLIEVKSPAECLLVSDAQPKPDGDWSASLWWPWIAAAGEGVSTRHLEHGGYHLATYKGQSTRYPDGRGNIVWVDGSVTARRSKDINDLAEHRRFWDPGQGVGGW